MQKVICTVACGPAAVLLSAMIEPLGAYAARWGFDLFVATDGRWAKGRPLAWSKIAVVEELIGRYDLVAWLDADTLIVDPSQDLTAELRPGKDLYLCHHQNTREGWWKVEANSGVFMLRSGDWARSFLDEVWAQEDLIHHGWWENAAVWRLLGYPKLRPRPDLMVNLNGPGDPRWTERTQIIATDWNSIPNWDEAEHPVIKHYCGLDHEALPQIKQLSFERRAELIRADRFSPGK